MSYTQLPHFLQSPAWASFQQALGNQVLTDQGDGWSYLAIVEQSSGIKRLYCPYGPTLSSHDALPPALASLQAQAKQIGAAFIRLQPTGAKLDDNLARQLNLRPIAYSQPSDTWTIDLTKPVDDLLADMKQNTRNVVRNYHKKGLSYRRSQDPADISELLRLLHQVAQHNQISVHSDDYLTTQANTLLPAGSASLHFIDYQEEVIAAALTYQDQTTVYYAHAAADHAHRKLNASTALLGEILLTAQRDAKTTLDLFGVTTSTDPNHKWAGFTRFKQSFGGQATHLGHTYELPVKRLTYLAYSTLRRFR